MPSFCLPQYKIRFGCKNGAGLIINGATTFHCTSSKAPGVLGVAFIQKHDYIAGLKRALQDPTSNAGQRYISAMDKYFSIRVSYILYYTY